MGGRIESLHGKVVQRHDDALADAVAENIRHHFHGVDLELQEGLAAAAAEAVVAAAATATGTAAVGIPRLWWEQRERDGAPLEGELHE